MAGEQAKPSHRELLRAAIDDALAKKPADLDALLKLLRESGCEVSKRGKSYRLKLPGWDKVARLDSLETGYTLEEPAGRPRRSKGAYAPSEAGQASRSAEGQSAD